MRALSSENFSPEVCAEETLSNCRMRQFRAVAQRLNSSGPFSAQRTYGRAICVRKFSAHNSGTEGAAAELEIMDDKVTKAHERNFHESTIE